MKRKDQDNYCLYGIIGKPLKHTLSPAMQNAALKDLKLAGLYMPIELPKKSLKDFFKTLTQFSIQGLNVTVPYKEDVIPYLDKVDREATKIGAVNTIQRKGNQLHGFNTDIFGFLTSLKKDLGVQPKGKVVLVIGAGGAAKACLYGLLLSGVKEIVLVNRTKSKAIQLAKKLKQQFKKQAVIVASFQELKRLTFVRQFDLIVNTSSCGLAENDPVLIPKKAIPKDRKLFVYDMIYNPGETKLLKAAKASGCRVSNGLGMLLYQGARAFEIWTGKKAPLVVMRQALESALKG